MADNVAGAAAWLGGTEIVNDSRTTAYLQNGIKPGTLTVLGDCGCPNVLQLAGCDFEYTTPAQDGAPWYDSSIPESAEFAGFLTTEFEGMGSTYERTVNESISDGASLGRSRFASRTLTWKGILFGSSCCGVAYGLRWLGKTLQGTKNCGTNCTGDDLEIMVCCPTMEAAQGYGPNVVCNSTFDFDTRDWASSGDTNITWVNYPVYETPGAMRVINPAGGSITFSTDCAMSVVGNRDYIFGAQVRGATGSNSETLVVSFNWYDELDTLLGTTSSGDLGMDNDEDWSLRQAVVTAPLSAVSVTMDFTIGDVMTLPNEAHLIDNVTFNQMNYAPVVEPFRTMKNVSLLEGPIISSERKMGSSCGGRCGGSTAIEIEFSLVASQPWMYSAPIPVVNCIDVVSNSVSIIGAVLTGTITNNPLTSGSTSITSNDFASLPVVDFPGDLYIILDPYATAGAPESVRVVAHTAGSTTITVIRGQQGTTARQHTNGTAWSVDADCAPENCGGSQFWVDVVSQIPTYAACAPPQLPPTATYVGCAIPDVNTWKAVYVTAPRAMWNSLSEVVPVITIQTAGLPVIGARLGFYTSADGNPCGDLFTTPPQCDLVCDQLYFSILPANSKFYIDGRNKKMTMVCGTNAAFPGEQFTLGPFSWPSFDCYGFCMEYAYDPTFESDGICISLSLVPRTTM